MIRNSSKILIFLDENLVSNLFIIFENVRIFTELIQYKSRLIIINNKSKIKNGEQISLSRWPFIKNGNKAKSISDTWNWV